MIDPAVLLRCGKSLALQHAPGKDCQIGAALTSDFDQR
jgi:hypothetical protein